jgi:uncharacterized protein
MKLLLLIIALANFVCFSTVSPVSADFSKAQEYYLLKDYVKAMEEYKKEDNPKAYYQIGYMYDHGEGVQQDTKEAAQWYTKAAEKGNAKAQYRLGLFYATGTGVDQNQKEAEKWYRKAAGQGFRPAKDALKKLEGSSKQ